MDIKAYAKQLAELNRIFKGEPPNWLLDKLEEHYEKTKDDDLTKLGGEIFDR